MIEKLSSKILLNIKGKNINRFIKKLISRKINILSLKYVNKNEVYITIYKRDYERVIKIKSIYQVNTKDTFGLIKIKKILKLNRYLIIIGIIGFILFYLLTNMIFSINIVHSNKDIRNLLKHELELNNIKKYTFKKNYKTLEKIKENILNKYPDKIEWLEIEEVGTEYIVRAEEREIINKKINNNPRNLIAKKDAVIKKITASKGSIVRNYDDYVKKGEVIVSGEVTLNEKVKGKVKAEGKVYGEVWYVITTEYPFAYFEKKETGMKKNIYTIKFLSNDIELTFNKFRHKKVDENLIFKSNIIPIKFVKQRQKEVIIKNEILTFDQALIKAKELSIKKVKDNLNENEYIIRSKYLKSRINKSTIEVDMFFAIYEDITDYKGIE